MILFGVEVGQGRRSSAICVATTSSRLVDDQTEVHFEIRTLERQPAGTSYPALAERLVAMERASRKRAPNDRIAIYVNATGLGEPLISYLDKRLHSRVRTVYFTHGDRRSEVFPHVELGKALLVTRLQLLLQTCRIHLPRTPQTETLAEELLDFEVRVESDANERYGSFAVGTQDDLVMALGLAVQTDRPFFGYRSGGSARPPGW